MKHLMKHFFKILLSLSCLTTLCAGAFGNDAWAQDAKPRLGLSVSPLQASPILLQHLRLADGEGLIVENIVAGSELEAAGLSQGDIVIAIDGNPLSKPQDLTTYIATKKSGDQITLDVIQKGEHRQIYVKLDNLPDEVLWKYAKPVAAPGKSRLGASPWQGSMRFSAPASPNSGASSTGASSVSGKSVYQSMVYSGGEMKSSSVTIDGPANDDKSIIEITIGNDSWKTTVGEISKLPDEAKAAAQAAISRSGSFSFSFGPADTFFEEMMNRQREQIEQMQRLMDKQFGPAVPAPSQTAPADAFDIQS